MPNESAGERTEIGDLYDPHLEPDFDATSVRKTVSDTNRTDTLATRKTVSDTSMTNASATGGMDVVSTAFESEVNRPSSAMNRFDRRPPTVGVTG